MRTKRRRAVLFTARRFISSFSSLLPCSPLRDLCNGRIWDKRCAAIAFLRNCCIAPGFGRLARRGSAGGLVDLKCVSALVEVACSYSLRLFSYCRALSSRQSRVIDRHGFCFSLIIIRTPALWAGRVIIRSQCLYVK
jgi:hypothetical protein